MSTQARLVGRIDYLDGLRAALMLLGIPYHAALAFSGEEWLVSSPSASPALGAVAVFLHDWRMPTFFIVAGFFAGLIVQRRGPNAWLRGRVTRLGVPLIFGVLLTVPLQWVLIGYHRFGNWTETWTFVLEHASAPSEWWILHLWFLLELLIYCAATAGLAASPLRHALRRLCDRVADTGRRHPALAGAAALVIASAAVVVGRTAWTYLHVDDILGGVVSRNLVVYAPVFAVGALLGVRRDLLASVTSRAAAITSAIAAIVASLVASVAPDSNVGAVVESSASTVVGLSAACVAMYLASRLLNRQRPVIRWLVDASLVIYIVHQPIIVALAMTFIPLGLVGPIGWAATILATFVFAALVYELVNLVPGVRFLLTGRSARQASLAKTTAKIQIA